MKIKLDENVPARLVRVLAELGHDTDTVAQQGLCGADDPVIWEAAQASGRFLITQDMDFADTRRFAPGGHHGVLLVRFRNPGRNAILRRLSALFQAEDIGSWSGCFVVATEQKLRVRRQKLPP